MAHLQRVVSPVCDQRLVPRCSWRGVHARRVLLRPGQQRVVATQAEVVLLRRTDLHEWHACMRWAGGRTRGAAERGDVDSQAKPAQQTRAAAADEACEVCSPLPGR